MAQSWQFWHYSLILTSLGVESRQWRAKGGGGLGAHKGRMPPVQILSVFSKILQNNRLVHSLWSWCHYLENPGSVTASALLTERT